MHHRDEVVGVFIAFSCATSLLGFSLDPFVGSCFAETTKTMYRMSKDVSFHKIGFNSTFFFF
jgi:hypothetical protein